MSDTTANSDEPKSADAWGDDITEEREAELGAILATWDAEADHGNRRGPFDGAHLSGADVF
ncbi:MAG TPA: hypothetical protein VH349_03600 [Ktedonobacterales bacterium]|jgi:hypothetical protein